MTTLGGYEVEGKQRLGVREQRSCCTTVLRSVFESGHVSIWATVMVVLLPHVRPQVLQFPPDAMSEPVLKAYIPPTGDRSCYLRYI
jgi:hypothetical protein